MPTDNPRVQVMLDDKTNSLLIDFAQTQKCSISSAAAGLIREALEIHEDVALSEHGDNRFFSNGKWIKHEDAWG